MTPTSICFRSTCVRPPGVKSEEAFLPILSGVPFTVPLRLIVISPETLTGKSPTGRPWTDPQSWPEKRTPV